MIRPAPHRRSVIGGLVASAASLSAPRSLIAAGTDWDVRISRFVFVPDLLVVQPGDRIRWINEDIAPHTATAKEFGWDTGPLERGQDAVITVTAQMETEYFCVFHPHMIARIQIG